MFSNKQRNNRQPLDGYELEQINPLNHEPSEQIQRFQRYLESYGCPPRITTKKKKEDVRWID